MDSETTFDGDSKGFGVALGGFTDYQVSFLVVTRKFQKRFNSLKCVSKRFRGVLVNSTGVQRRFGTFHEVSEGSLEASQAVELAKQGCQEEAYHGDSGHFRRFKRGLSRHHRLSGELYGGFRGFERRVKTVQCMSGCLWRFMRMFWGCFEAFL